MLNIFIFTKVFFRSSAELGKKKTAQCFVIEQFSQTLSQIIKSIMKFLFSAYAVILVKTDADKISMINQSNVPSSPVCGDLLPDPVAGIDSLSFVASQS